MCIFPALESSSTETARCSVLKLALISLDHDDEHVHDKELKFGADSIVCNCLRRAVAIDVKSRETDRLCRLLEAIYKCSDAMAAASFCRYGAVLFPLLVTVASSSSPRLRSKMAAARLLQRTNPLGILLSAIKDADLLMIALVRFLRTCLVDCQNNALLALGSIIIHRESKPIVARFPGLLEAVIGSAEKCKGEAVAVLMNLASDSRNKAAIAKTRGLLELLKRSCASKEPGIRRNACSSLVHLSSESSIKEMLVTFESGLLVDRLNNLLRDGKSDIRYKALQTISNMVSESTANVIGNATNLLEQLGDIGSSSPATDCSIVASKAIKRLSTYMQTRHKGHQTLCEALVRMSKSPGFDVSLWTARAYIGQSLNVSSSFFMVRSESAIAGLLSLARSKHGRVRASAVEAIANLVQEPANARRLSTNEAVVNTLIYNIDAKGDTGGTENARRQAVRAILLIANHRSASKRAAKQRGLIQSLSRYGTSVDGDIELKRAALHGVLVLAPSM